MNSNKIILCLLLMGTGTLITASAQKSNLGAVQMKQTLATTTLITLDKIATCPPKLQMACSLALYDFNQSCKNPNYQITYGPSKKMLAAYNLLDGNQVQRGTCEALKSVGYFKNAGTVAAQKK